MRHEVEFGVFCVFSYSPWLCVPADSDEVTYSSTIMSNTTQKFVRVRGRQMAVKFKSTGTDEKWRLGDSRIDIRPDGRR